MEKYRGVLKQRIFWLVTLDVLALAFIIVTGIYSSDSAGFTAGFIRGVQLGVFLGLQGFILFFALRYYRALKDENRLKGLRIAEDDERAKLIRDKIGGGGFMFSIAGTAAATVAAGFFNETVFFTLLAVTFFMVSIKASLKIYYHQKY